VECELMETCSFYWNYKNHPESIDRKLISLYCNSGDIPESCARIQHIIKHKESPPPGMTPEGDNLNKTEKESHMPPQLIHRYC